MSDIDNKKLVITEPGILIFGSGLLTGSSITSFFRGETVVQVTCNSSHSAVVCESGRVYTFGEVQSNGRLTKDAEPRLVDTLSTVRVTQAACGYKFTMFLTDEGELYSCGSNDCGQLGLGHTAEVLATVLVPGLPTIKKIAAGSDYSMALADGGDVWVCGANRYGQLGLGHENKQLRFTCVPNLPEPIIDISCGGYHTALISASRVLLMAGCSLVGQLGLGKDCRYVSIFERVSVATTSIATISCGSIHTVALGVNGTILAWGANGNGQLGTGDTDDRFTPTKVIGLKGRTVSRVIAGDYRTAVLSSEGDVLIYGNSIGEQMDVEEYCILTFTLIPNTPGLVVQQVAFVLDHLLLLVVPSITPARPLQIGIAEQANQARDRMTDLERSIMRSLECPVCLKIMCAPIHQCVKGHSLCGSCRSDINTPVCLLCREQFSAVRNISLEGLSAEVVLPCAECLLRMPASVMAKHGGVCPERQYGCPVSDRCGWAGRPETMLAHAGAAHPDRTWTDLPHVFAHTTSERMLRTDLLGAHGQVFTLHRSWDDQQFQAAVRIVGPADNSHDFKFELAFINSDMTSITYCKNVSTDIDSIEDAFQSFSNSVSMKKEMVEKFLQQGCLVCRAAILKMGNSGFSDQIKGLLSKRLIDVATLADS